MLSVYRSFRALRSSALRSDSLHTSTVCLRPAQTTTSAKPARMKRGAYLVPEMEGLDEDLDGVVTKDDGQETSALGHLMLRQQRQVLHYLRLIEHEMPKLVAYRKPFVPPSQSMPLVVRSISYGGEDHPAALKCTIVVPVSRLPLKDNTALHKFKLLAGPRWTLDPPLDAGLAAHEGGSEHGYFKISCEDFPKAAMNVKWASDTLDRLLTEANNTKDSFEDVPLDMRHIEAKRRKAGKGDHVYGRRGIRPSLKHFPKEWLPTPAHSTSLPLA